jgi:hypothetical protein
MPRRAGKLESQQRFNSFVFINHLSSVYYIQLVITTAMLSRAWTYTPQDALAFYDSHPENGLSEPQVKRNRELYGENCTSSNSP